MTNKDLSWSCFRVPCAAMFATFVFIFRLQIRLETYRHSRGI